VTQFLTSAEIAALALPGLPATRQGVDSLAEREGWNQSPLRRLRQGRGGGVEYRLDLLPRAALLAYAARRAGLVDATPESCQAVAETFSPPLDESRDARLAILAASTRLARETGLSQASSDAYFAALYNEGRLDVAPWVRAAVAKTSAKTLERWRALAKRDCNRLGVDRGAARRGKGVLDSCLEGKVGAFLEACIVHQPHWSASHLLGALEKEFPGFAPPSERTIQAFVARMKRDNKQIHAKIANPDKFKSAYRLVGSNSHAVTRLNELWQIDASPADMLCTDGRYSVYVCIDIFSRRLVVAVSKTPSAQAVALLMRKAILAWGVPERLKLDNGSDFIAKSSQRLFASLQIEVEFSRPFSPWEKGHVERAIKTFQHDLTPLLPGFVGHNVADRKVIEERKAFSARLGQDDARAFGVELTAKELQSYCDDWAEKRYGERAHSALKGVSPNARAASYAGKIRRVENPRGLDLLLAPLAGSDGLRTVGKQGLRIEGSFYLPSSVLPGEKVFVRMDPADLGVAYLFSLDGERYLGDAICPELAGVDPIKALAEAKKAQKALLDDGVARLRSDIKKIKPRDMAEALLRREAQDNGTLLYFPRPSETHETPALTAASAAIAGEAVAPEPDNGAFESTEALIDAAMTHPKVVALPETRQQRFRRALEMDARLERGEPLTNEELLWLGGYREGSEWKALRQAFEDFGESALL